MFWTSHGDNKDGSVEFWGLKWLQLLCLRDRSDCSTPTNRFFKPSIKRAVNVSVDKYQKWCFKAIVVSNITSIAVNLNDLVTPGRCCPISQRWKERADI